MKTGPLSTKWIKGNYELLSLIVSLILLLASAFWLIVKLSSEKDKIKAAEWKQNLKGAVAETIDLKSDDILLSIEKPYQAGMHSNRMWVSELRVSAIGSGKPIPYRAEACTFTGVAQPPLVNPKEVDSDADGMTDVFEVQFGFNPNDPDDATFDLDGDDFSNLEEYHAGTPPNNEKIYPALPAKLRYKRVKAIPFKLRFNDIQELSGGMLKFQLNLRDLSRTYFKGIGDEVQGYKLISYNPDAKAGPTLVMKKKGRLLSLVKGRVINEDEWVCELIFLIDSSRHIKRKDDVIKLRDEEYKVIDINRDGVLIQSLKTQDKFEISPLSLNERDGLSMQSSERINLAGLAW